MNRLAAFISLGTFALLTAGFVMGQQNQQNQGQQKQGQGQQKQGQGQQKNQPNQGQGSVKGGQFNGPINQNAWFAQPDIRQQLKLNDDQFNSLNKAHSQAWERYNSGMSSLGKDLKPDQIQERRRDLEQNYYKQFSNATNDVITDPQTRERYNQLYLQYRGYDAFNDPTIQEKLRLTPEQRQKLGQYGQEWTKSMGELGQMYQSDREGATKRFNDMRQREMDRLGTVLTPEQRQTWQKMTGDPYRFQPNSYFQSSASTTNPSSSNK